MTLADVNSLSLNIIAYMLPAIWFEKQKKINGNATSTIHHFFVVRWMIMGEHWRDSVLLIKYEIAYIKEIKYKMTYLKKVKYKIAYFKEIKYKIAYFKEIKYKMAYFNEIKYQ